MKIKSAKSFREWYKNLTPARRQAAQNWDENFIGVQHNELSGFFSMYHGDKEQVYDFLRKEVEMAEDGQAIYEFVQNAADSNSTQFYMFYDEQHLVVINNGDVFTKEGIKSILNIGQSYGKQDPEKIGRYGIGFKLVHRLIGKSSGLDELLNVDKQGFRGPILFSWSEKTQFDNFLTADQFDYIDFNDDIAPWLLKILITNFPAQPSEKVKDINFEEIEPFQFDELKQFQSFLIRCRDKIDLNLLNSGTIFFLQLGEGKFNYLEKQQGEYLNGLSTSMHFLKSLDTLIINNEKVNKDKDAANILEFIVQNGSEEFNNIGLTEIRDKGSDAKFKICFANNTNSAIELKKNPNIYKFFPAVKEVNNLSFVIHCNLFELSSNRQNLTETPINKNLLSLLSKQLKEKMETLKLAERETFKNLFTSILMSEKTSSNSGSGWQSEFFYEDLLTYISKNVPTKNNYSDNPQNVKIYKLKQLLNLSDFGLGHIEWFEWDNETDNLLIDEAKSKLGIESWDIRDIVENADLDKINEWIANCDNETYDSFLKELEEKSLKKSTLVQQLRKIKLLKFSDGRYYSFLDILERDCPSHYYGSYVKYKFKSNLIFLNSKINNISNEIKKIGIAVSNVKIEDYKNIFSVLENLPSDEKYFDAILNNCKSNEQHLETNEIKSLIKFYQDNQKQFFKEFIIKKTDNEFLIIQKINDTFQVQTSDKEARNFIANYCVDNLFILPYEFLEFKEEAGVLKNNDLYNYVIDCVKVNDLKKELIDIISPHYVSYQAKLKFLDELSELKFIETLYYTYEDFEYKALNMACSVIDPQNIIQFRQKIIIESNGIDFPLLNINSEKDKIQISNKPFSLSKILPATHQNSNLVGDLISLFTEQGIPTEKLNALFGVNEELDIEDVFEKFTEQTEVFENTEQFFFLVYYNQHIGKVDLSKLGFDLSCAVYPSDFALEKERLPEYLQNWITNKEINLSELEEIGIFTENSTLVSLRKFFLSNADFNVNAIAEKLSSIGTMLLNTLELLKEKGNELSNDKEVSIFKEIVRVINTSRAKGQELIIQDEYNFGTLEEKSTEWKTINDFSIYLYKGILPKFVILDEIQDYIFYHYNDTDFVVNGNKIYLNENADRNKVLMEVATFLNDNNFTLSVFGGRTDETEKLKQENEALKKQLQGDKKQDDPNPNNSFLDDVNEFISELEGTEWNGYIPELKNLLQGFNSQTPEKQKLFNLIAKIKLTKEINVKFEDTEEYNVVKIGDEQYFVHSARGAFAYVHPSELLKMNSDGYKMALDFGKKFKIYESAEDVLKLNTDHILAYQGEKSNEELFSFCEANRDKKKHFLIIDKDNASEKSRTLLKLLNIEDDYQ